MANRKAGSAGDGNTGEAKRPAAGKKTSGTAGGAGESAQTGGTRESAQAGGPGKQAAGSRGAAATTRGASSTSESQPKKGGGRSAVKGAAKTATNGSAGDAPGAASGAAKNSAKGAAKGASKGAAKGAAKSGGRGAGKLDLRSDLRQFVSENPQGWGHDQWQDLLDRLGQRGHDVSNPDQIGMQLERERLSSRLERVDGVSAQKARTIVDRFGTVYSLRNADVEEIAREAKVSNDVAERIKSQLQ